MFSVYFNSFGVSNVNMNGSVLIHSMSTFTVAIQIMDIKYEKNEEGGLLNPN